MSNEIHKLNIEDILLRIKSVLGKDSNQKSIASELGVKAQDVSNWKTRNTIPFESLHEFSRKNNISFNWLLSGDGDKQKFEYPININVISKNEKDLLDKTVGDYRGIPFYTSGRIDAGSNGAQFDIYEEPESIVIVYKPELKSCSNHRLFAMRVGGDSMEKTIPEGAIIVVDVDDREYERGRIFAVNKIEYGIDIISVKRVRRGAIGFVLVSDNRDYLDEPSELDWNELCVGRVVWMWRDLKYQ